MGRQPAAPGEWVGDEDEDCSPVVAYVGLCKAPQQKRGLSCGLMPLMLPDGCTIPHARETGVLCFGVRIQLVTE